MKAMMDKSREDGKNSVRHEGDDGQKQGGREDVCPS